MPRTQEAAPESLRGRVDQLRFTSATFTVGVLRVEGGGRVTFAGPVALAEGDRVELLGSWDFHERFGKQFKVRGFNFDQRLTAEGLADYLANNPDFVGIGPKKAEKIVARFGADFDRIITEEPHRLREAASLSLAVIEKVREVWIATRSQNQIRTWLAGLGLTHHQIVRIVDSLGNDAKALLERNPYQLLGQVEGFGFKRVDEIARRMGTPMDRPERLRAGLQFVVEEHVQSGDCWVDYQDLLAEAVKTLFLDMLDAEVLVEAQLAFLLDAGALTADSASCRILVGSPRLRDMEVRLWDIFRGGTRANPHFDRLSTAALEALCPAALNPGQRRAFLTALTSNLMVLSGAAGTGKTRTIDAITQAYAAAGKKVVLAAPTGKAAKRMEEVTRRPAMTLHRLLEFNGLDWGRNPENPIEADVLIVDEVSMVDIPLASRLFDAISLRRTCVVLAGDHNQLPPVGPGNLLRDLIDREPIPIVVLEQVVRQAGVLCSNSLALLRGQVSPTEPMDVRGQTPWVIAGKFNQAADALEYVLHLYEDVLVQKLKLNPLDDVQVLSPRRDGPLGVEQLNIALQKHMQRLWDVTVEPVPEGRRPKLYLHDKVINVRNNYGKGVMNGELGFVVGLGSIQTELEGTLKRHEVLVEFEGKKRVAYDIARREDEDLQLAYALTIHRAQGSEVKCAIVVIHRAHSFMHHRNLFYTAVTRAQQTAIVVGDAWGIHHCAEVEEVGRRKTFLSVLSTLSAEAA